MKRFIDVHGGEVMAGQGDVVLKSNTNGSCLVIVAYDSIKKIGGLAHAIFFSNGLSQRKRCTVMRDADEAIDELLKDMTLLGAQRENIEVYLVTGENVPHKQNDPDYEKNISSTIDLLKQKHIRIKEQLADDLGYSHISFDVESGSILYE